MKKNKFLKVLESIADKLILNIKEGNYDDAYIKMNTLYYTSGWSSEIEGKLDETRESLLERIEKARNVKN